VSAGATTDATTGATTAEIDATIGAERGRALLLFEFITIFQFA
jgi:hypothetical protein